MTIAFSQLSQSLGTPGEWSNWRRLFSAALLSLLLASCAGTRAPLGPVVIVVSSHAAVFERVAQRLVGRLNAGTAVYYLTGNREKDARILGLVQHPKWGQVVVIGLWASIWSKQLTGKQIVFSQVFNYQQHKLIAGYRKGVSAVPPPYQFFYKWKLLSPKLRRVAVVTGPQQEDLVYRAQRAAQYYGISLRHDIVRSDKEFVYTYKRIAPKQQGMWLLPDNRVLSRKVIRDVLSYSVKHGKQVLVHNPQLLKFGGLISAEAQPDDVAEQVHRRLRKGAGNTVLPEPAIRELTKTRFRINRVMAMQLGLNIQPRNRRR